MDKYYFLYKNSIGKWYDCINPVFIASHQHCRAIPKEIVNDKLQYDFIIDLMHDLNNNVLNSHQLSVLAEFDIHI